MSTVRCWPMTQSSASLGINARVDIGLLAPYSGRASGAIYDPWNLARASPCNKVALLLWHRR